MSPTPRVRPGTPDGGRFAATAHPEATISLSEDDMVSFDLADLDRCPVCTGTGAAASGAACSVCQGEGSLGDDAAWSRAQATERDCTRTCPECDEGLRADLTFCALCDGTGTIIDYSLAG